MRGIMMIRIRSASLRDVKEVSKLIRAGAEEGMLLSRTEKELNALARKDDVVVASDGGRLVGVVILDFYNARVSEMRSLYVIPEYRHTGLGSRLVGRLKRRAKSHGVKELMTITHKRKKDWFVRQGFSEEAHGFKIALFKEL